MNTTLRGRQISYTVVVMFALGFWLSASLLLDSVIIPSLSMGGMMTPDSFPIAGYMLFSVFNRLELFCAALILTGFLILHRNNYLIGRQQPLAVGLSILLLGIALIYTYVFTPQMSALGLNLNLFDSIPPMSTAMISLHGGYWALEIVKFFAGATLLRWCYSNSCDI